MLRRNKESNALACYVFRMQRPQGRNKANRWNVKWVKRWTGSKTRSRVYGRSIAVEMVGAMQRWNREIAGVVPKEFVKSGGIKSYELVGSRY